MLSLLTLKSCLLRASPVLGEETHPNTRTTTALDHSCEVHNHNCANHLLLGFPSDKAVARLERQDVAVATIEREEATATSPCGLTKRVGFSWETDESTESRAHHKQGKSHFLQRRKLLVQ